MLKSASTNQFVWKLSLRPGRGHEQLIRDPIEESVIKAVFISAPPKHMFVVKGSFPTATCSTDCPSGLITVIPPGPMVATQMLPFSSSAMESKLT